MTDIIVRETTDDVELGERAHLNYGGILEAKGQVGRDFLVLGRLLKENRDKRYFKALGYDTFEDFLGSPDIAMSRSMVFDLIRAVEVFIDKLARPMDELAPIGISKLSAIAKDDKAGQPVVYQDVEEWMSKAKELSRSDLLEEVAPFTPNAKVRRSDAPRSTDWRSIRPGEHYVEYVREVPCAICGKHSNEGAKTHAAHFPIGRGAGAPDDWVIPMCGDCHAEHHHDPNAFMVKYARQWGSWFYRLVAEAFDLTRDDTTKATPHYKPTDEEELQPTTSTTKSDTTSTTKATRRRLTPSARDLGLNPRALGTNPKAMGTNPKALGSVLVAPGETLGRGESSHSPLDTRTNESLSVSEGSRVSECISPSSHPEEELMGGASGSGLGRKDVGLAISAEGLNATASDLACPPPSAEPKQIWPPEGGFDKCYECHMTWPVSDMVGGLCPSCQPKGLSVDDDPSEAHDMDVDILTFPNPASAKRRGKKGGSK